MSYNNFQQKDNNWPSTVLNNNFINQKNNSINKNNYIPVPENKNINMIATGKFNNNNNYNNNNPYINKNNSINNINNINNNILNKFNQLQYNNKNNIPSSDNAYITSSPTTIAL